jgi:hypothetical protein
VKDCKLRDKIIGYNETFNHVELAL